MARPVLFVERRVETAEAVNAASRVDRLGTDEDEHRVDRHVIDAALGEQLFDITVGQAIAQIPADRDRDYLTREPITGRRRR
jgi:hypothetical protein